MSFLDSIAQKWRQFCDKAAPTVKKVKTFTQLVFDRIAIIWQYIFKLRKVIMAVPVAWGAIWLGIRNLTELPDTVGLDLQSDGTFSILIARELAVLGPIAITALCLLLMFGSKRTLTPWLVSLFSLAIPLVILITNTFPS